MALHGTDAKAESGSALLDSRAGFSFEPIPSQTILLWGSHQRAGGVEPGEQVPVLFPQTARHTIAKGLEMPTDQLRFLAPNLRLDLEQVVKRVGAQIETLQVERA